MTVNGLTGTVTAVAAGSSHTVALMSNGTVKAWGANTAGELGDGTLADRNRPVTVLGLTITANGAPPCPNDDPDNARP